MGLRLALAITVNLAVGLVALPVSSATCPDCVSARYWEVAPDDWLATGPPDFPEREGSKLDRLRPVDLGVAFSGGGTRSAAATIGQLRGLMANGWLDRVRYITAVSGGSWAAVPFTYHEGDLGTLLGQPTLNLATLTSEPNGTLARLVTESGLAQVGLQEVAQFLPEQGQVETRWGSIDLGRVRRVLTLTRSAVRRLRGGQLPEPDRRNKTYAHLLGQIFVDPVVPDGNRQPYTWDRETAVDSSLESGRPISEFTQVPRGRPFLVVGGTLVWQHPALSYPRLIPVEYTPLYTGIRQRFGALGGTYVRPWAYDRLEIAAESDTLVRVGPAPMDRPFTLADMIASSGAAPQLTLLLGDDDVPERFRDVLREAATAFPAFSSLTVREGQPLPLSGELAHGDGGFTDNLGLMPLLARQVRNIIVFVNSNREYDDNDQLQSYFMPLGVRTGSGDKSMNAVFDPVRYIELLDGLDAITAQGGPAVYCGTWPVRRNELYNIRAYDDANICWVYNFAAEAWKAQLPDTVRQWLQGEGGREAKALQHFPYFATFGENKPYVIKLNTLQVNLLADLAAWSVTNETSVRTIRRAFGDAMRRRTAVR